MNESDTSSGAQNGGTSSRSIPPPPIFSVLGVDDNKIGKTGIISLVDIFDEFLFAPDRTNNSVLPNNSLVPNQDSSLASSSRNQTISGLDRSKIDIHSNKRDVKDIDDTLDGRDDEDNDYDSCDDDVDVDGFLDENTEEGKKRKRSRGIQRNMTEIQKVERR
jgi:hypothetical protein